MSVPGAIITEMARPRCDISHRLRLSCLASGIDSIGWVASNYRCPRCSRFRAAAVGSKQ